MSAFLEPIGDTVACVAKAKINLSPNGRAMVGKIHALTLNDDKPITLKCRPVLLFKVRMQYEIVRTEHEPERGPWRVSTRGYMYELQTASGELVWSYHWHPTSNWRTACPPRAHPARRWRGPLLQGAPPHRPYLSGKRHPSLCRRLRGHAHEGRLGRDPRQA